MHTLEYTLSGVFDPYLSLLVAMFTIFSRYLTTINTPLAKSCAMPLTKHLFFGVTCMISDSKHLQTLMKHFLVGRCSKRCLEHDFSRAFSTFKGQVAPVHATKYSEANNLVFRENHSGSRGICKIWREKPKMYFFVYAWLGFLEY